MCKRRAKMRKILIKLLIPLIGMIFVSCGEVDSVNPAIEDSDNLPQVSQVKNSRSINQSEIDLIKNNVHTLSWAYYQEGITADKEKARWYISSYYYKDHLGKVLSLMPIENGNPGWGLVSNTAGNMNIYNDKITVGYIPDKTSCYYDDEVLGKDKYNCQIKKDVELIRDSTVDLVWWFFKAPNDGWYIVRENYTKVLKFASTNGQYDWNHVVEIGIKPTIYVENGVKKLKFEDITNDEESIINKVITYTMKGTDDDDFDKKVKVFKFNIDKSQKLFFKVKSYTYDNIAYLNLYDSYDKFIYTDHKYYEDVNFNIDNSTYDSSNKYWVDSFSNGVNKGNYSIKVTAKEGVKLNLYTTIIKEEYKIPNVNFLSQVSNGSCLNSCGFASSAMLYGFYTKKQIDSSITNTMANNTNRCGLMSDIFHYGKGLKSIGINNVFIKSITYDEIKAYISNDIPLQVTIPNYSDLDTYRAKAGSTYTQGHAVVVVGYSELKQEWYIHDPLEKSQGYKAIPSSIFRKAISDNTDYVTVIGIN